MRANTFIEWAARYRNEPVLFVKEVFGETPDEWQVQFLEAVARGDRRITVRSGHGVGKSAVAAWASVWFLLTRYTCRVVVTAPTSTQLFDALFAEIKRWISRLPDSVRVLLEVKADRIELIQAPECYITARTSRSETPEALAGVHADHIMLIADEASGIPESVFEAGSGSMSSKNAVTMLLGNPVRSSGFFYNSHMGMEATQWTKFHVSGISSSRVTPEYVEEMEVRYGEDSNAFRIRVLGEFPKVDDDTVIPMELLELATQRDVMPYGPTPTVWGLDVARFGSDSCALAKRSGRILHGPLSTWAGLDLMQSTGRVLHEYEETSPDKRPVEILVDSIGLGSGIVDRLRELKLPVRGINVSESPALGDKYLNLRSELWYKAKTWLERRDCAIPKDERLISQLATVRYSFTSNNKVKVEGKDSIRKRLRGRSTDVADAFLLTFASNAATALHGSGGLPSRPMRRDLGLA